MARKPSKPPLAKKAPKVGAKAADESNIFDLLSESLDADMFVFSGPITRDLADGLLCEIEQNKTRTNAALVLCTYGGDADAAYLIARTIKSHYEKFVLYVFGFCKSAGTLVALGADEIVMSKRGELGPLDVQALKRDDLIYRSSGLDITQALRSLSERTYDVFIEHFYNSIYSTKGAITTKTATDIATTLAVGLIAPITAQIDPLRVGEIERAVTIAYHYGVRLNGDEKRVNGLIRNYPSHSFVIDYAEAQEIFGNVREPDDQETLFEKELKRLEVEKEEPLISAPNNEGLVGCFNSEADDESNDADEREPKQEALRTNGQRNNTKTSAKTIALRTAKQNKNGHKSETIKIKTR